jgi:predicted TIM-barrel fold metal-dependent hydrolase
MPFLSEEDKLGILRENARKIFPLLKLG